MVNLLGLSLLSLCSLAAAYVEYPLHSRKNHRIVVGADNHPEVKSDSKVAGAEPLQKRDLAGLKVLEVPTSFYYVNVSIGSPPQEILMVVDPSSGDMTVSSYNSSYSSEPGYDLFSYDPSKSKTFVNTSDPFNYTNFYFGTFAGNYVADRVEFGGVTLDNQTFALASQDEYYSDTGIFGLGTSSAEGVVNAPSYANVIGELVRLGKITSNVAVLNPGLDGSSNGNGSLMLGAIDTSAYKDPLVVLPLDQVQGDSGHKFSFVTLTGLQAVGADQSANLDIPSEGLPVLLAPSEGFSYLPYQTIVSIATQLDALYSPDLSLWIQSCSFMNLTGTLDFHFYDAVISIPLGAFFMPLYMSDNDSTPLTLGNGRAACALSFVDSERTGVSILGFNVLNAMYMAFDFDNNRVGIAEAITPNTADSYAFFSALVQEVNVSGTATESASSAGSKSKGKGTATATTISVATESFSGRNITPIAGTNLTDVSGVKVVTPSVTLVVPLSQPDFNFSVTGQGIPRIVLSSGEFITSNQRAFSEQPTSSSTAVTTRVANRGTFAAVLPGAIMLTIAATTVAFVVLIL